MERRDFIKSAAGLSLVLLTGERSRFLGEALAAEQLSGPLNVFSWSSYEWTKEVFKQKASVDVSWKYQNSDESAVGELQVGGLGVIDAVTFGEGGHAIVIDGGLVEPLRLENIPNYSKLYPVFKDRPSLERKGQVYGVTWDIGTSGISYNAKRIPEGVSSWSALFDPKYAGRIAVRDEALESIMIAAFVTGQNPQRPSDFQAIKKKLIEQKRLVKTYWKTASEAYNLMGNEEIWMTNMWAGTGHKMTVDMPGRVKYVLPREGGIGWSDVWFVPKKAPHRLTAEKWIDFLISGELLASLVRRQPGRAVANPEVLKFLKPEERKLILADAERDKLVLYPSLAPKDLQTWVEVWNEVKTA